MARSLNTSDPFLARLEAAFRRLKLTDLGVLVAVSGGADSTALAVGVALLADRLRLSVELASIDHGLRPTSAKEVEGVRALARRLELPFHTRALGLVTGSALEARARQARYQALEAIRQERGLDVVATAHTASDQAETVLMRLSRGSALRGAGAILPARERVVRPMLEMTREEVEVFLAAHQISFVVDPMNADERFARTRVRRRVLPVLEEALGPGAARALARFARAAQEDERYLWVLAEEAYARLLVGPNALDAAGVRALAEPLRRRVVVKLIETAHASVDADTLGRALAAIEAHGTATLAKRLVLKAQSGVVRVLPGKAPAAPPAEAGVLELDGTSFEDAASGLTFSLRSSPPQDPGPLDWPLADVGVPLTVRHRLPGDRVGRRKLQDLLVDAKVRAEDRNRIPLVCDRNGRIVWVVGFWPARAQGGGGLYVHAEPTVGSQAREWLVRYRLAP